MFVVQGANSWGCVTWFWYHQNQSKEKDQENLGTTENILFFFKEKKKPQLCSHD